MLKSEILKINAKCANRFHLDVFRAVCWKEKSLIKGIELEGTASEGHENTVVIYTLSFNNVYTGKGWSAQKIGVAPFLEIKKEFPMKNSTLASVSTVARAQIGETVNRKSVSALQKLTAKFTDEICKRLYDMVNGASVTDGPKNIFYLDDEAKNKMLAEALQGVL